MKSQTAVKGWDGTSPHHMAEVVAPVSTEDIKSPQSERLHPRSVLKKTSLLGNSSLNQLGLGFWQVWE